MSTPVPGRDTGAIESFDPEAASLIGQYARQFASDLIVRSQEIAIGAHRRRVRREDVLLALQEVNQERKRTSRRELAMLLGSACLGAALQGSITELGMAPLRFLWLAVYIGLGLLGLGLLFYGSRS
jgi:hypothetical protein